MPGLRECVSAFVIVQLFFLGAFVTVAESQAVSLPGPYQIGSCEYVTSPGGDEYCEVFTPFTWSTGAYYLFTASVSGRLMRGAVSYAESPTQALPSDPDLYPGLGVDSATKGMLEADWFRVRATPPGFVMPITTWGATSPPGSGTPTGVFQYVRLTLTNTQQTGTDVGFDQRLVVNFSRYSSLLNSDVGNVAFYSSNWTPLYAWLENASTAPSLDSSDTVWVRLADAIPGRDTLTLYMTFLGTNESRFSSNGYWGEAPQLSTAYGSDDNGALVFPVYDDFKGTSLSAIWISDGAYVKVDDGVTIAGSSPVLPWSRDLIKLKQDYGGKDFTADAWINTLATGRTGIYIVDSASDAAHLAYDTGAADTVLVDQSSSYFWIDVKVGPAGQTTTVTPSPTAHTQSIIPLLLLLLGVLLVAVILMAVALAGLAIYLARRARWDHGHD